MKKLLIANRGEIAVRIIRTARDMGLGTVVVVSEPDSTSLAARTADESVVVGPAPAPASYLNQDAIIAAAWTPAATQYTPAMASSRRTLPSPAK